MIGRGSVVVNVGEPVAARSTPVYKATIVDSIGNPLVPAQLQSLTLTICDTFTGTIINNVSRQNILNTGRGSLDSFGNLTIMLRPGDTDMSDVPGESSVQRSLVIDWVYNGGTSVDRHQANITVLALAPGEIFAAASEGPPGATGPTGATGVGFGGFGDLDGGYADATYGGVTPIDAGTA